MPCELNPQTIRTQLCFQTCPLSAAQSLNQRAQPKASGGLSPQAIRPTLFSNLQASTKERSRRQATCARTLGSTKKKPITRIGAASCRERSRRQAICARALSINSKKLRPRIESGIMPPLPDSGAAAGQYKAALGHRQANLRGRKLARIAPPHRHP